MVVLNGGFARGEHTLSDRGYAREVVHSRPARPSAVEFEFRGAVESILDRRVRSFMSANDPLNDLQAEIFVLFPAESSAAPEAASGASELGERARRAREQHRELLSEHRALRSEQKQVRKAIHHDRDGDG